MSPNGISFAISYFTYHRPSFDLLLESDQKIPRSLFHAGFSGVISISFFGEHAKAIPSTASSLRRFFPNHYFKSLEILYENYMRRHECWGFSTAVFSAVAIPWAWTRRQWILDQVVTTSFFSEHAKVIPLAAASRRRFIFPDHYIKSLDILCDNYMRRLERLGVFSAVFSAVAIPWGSSLQQ